jgi:hypothetical protein
MITDSMLKIMQQIKELDPNYEFITDEEIEESIKECKKEDPNFEITEESLEADLREYLSFLRLLPEMEKIAEIDVNSIKGDDSESDFIIEEIDD